MVVVRDGLEPGHPDRYHFVVEAILSTYTM